MGKTYEGAPAEMISLAESVRQGPEVVVLDEQGVTVNFLLVFNDNGPALVRGGFEREWKTVINALRFRKEGLSDATVMVDGGRWESWSVEQREARLYSALYALEVVQREGGVVTDDIGRPKLRLRAFDWSVEGYASSAREFKEVSGEVESAMAFREEYGQLLWEFAGEGKARRGRGSSKSSGVVSEQPSLSTVG